MNKSVLKNLLSDLRKSLYGQRKMCLTMESKNDPLYANLEFTFYDWQMEGDTIVLNGDNVEIGFDINEIETWSQDDEGYYFDGDNYFISAMFI